MRVRGVRFGILCMVAMLSMVLGGLVSAFAEEENLLYNGDFAVVDEDGIPDGWYTEAYINDPGYTVFSMSPEDHSFSIKNVALNDARLAQVAGVLPESLYKLTGYIRAEGVTEGHGANLSIEGVYAFSEGVYDTGGEWEYIEWYGETGPDQEFVTIFARLGGYSGESKGQAWFRDLTLTEVDEVPGDGIAALWYKEERQVGYYDDEEDEGEDAAPFWPFLLILSAGYAVLTAGLLIATRDGQVRLLRNRTAERLALGAGLLAALILRLILSVRVEGYSVDVNCFLSWGATMAKYGPTQFYTQTSFCDYPPAYIWILGLNSLLSKWLGTSGGNTQLIFRMIPNLCDLVSAALIFRWAVDNDKTDSEPNRTGSVFASLAAGVAVLFAWNPATVMNSAAWGQMDSVLCLLVLLVAYLAIRGKWAVCLPVYMLAVLVKPQALMLGFLGLAAVGQAWLRDPASRKRILIGLGISAAVFAIIVIPFSVNQPWDWLIMLYNNTLGSYPYAVLNTSNFYYLLGGNWVPIERSALWLAPVLLALVTGGYGALWWFRAGRTAKRKWIEPAMLGAFAVFFVICAITGARWIVVGAGAMALAFAIVLSLYMRKGEISFLPFAGGLLFILLYVFGIKMHERYLLPALFLLTAAWAVKRDRRILYLTALFSVCVFINEGIVLDNSIRLGSEMGHLNNDTVWLADILSVMEILGAGYACWLGVEGYLGHEPKALNGDAGELAHAGTAVSSVRSPLEWHPDGSLHWKAKDTVIVCTITAVFSAVSLLTLGSAKAPQTAWSSSSYEENIVFDLGEGHDPVYVLYFGQVSRYDFTLAQSYDGANWSEEVYAQMDQGQCWKWKYVTQSWETGGLERTYSNSSLSNVLIFSGRYIRLTAHQIGLKLNELLFRTPAGEVLTPVIVGRYEAIEDSELYSDPANLLDEQDTMEGLPRYFPVAEEDEDEAAIPQPTWWNSMYFDEIYHARTAWEFLHASSPYETTHPPLGKVLMAAGIALLGMTPFGWRFAGALAGILMLPGMYLVGKQLTKKTWVGALSCGLMALDCMHLTQTQIATIDSFPVLFIIFAYFFMLRFMQLNLLTEKWSRLLWNLGLSGFFMGLAIASKWIGMYAGAGLAVLFAWHCLRHVRMRMEAERLAELSPFPGQEKLRPWLKEEGKRFTPETRRILILCAWCILFFLVIPAIIYALSYIPYFAWNSAIKTPGAFFKALMAAQESMFSYHSSPGLGADHPFASPWWQWPIIGKPMYYSTEQYKLGNGLYHSIFCIGNPVVWYGGLAGLAACLFWMIRGWHYPLAGSGRKWHIGSRKFDDRWGFLFIGLAAQYLPWVLVPRGTYIYHYFASIPFLVWAIALALSALEDEYPKVGRAVAAAIAVLAVAGFVIFFPYASGIMCPAEWLDLGKKVLKIWY